MSQELSSGDNSSRQQLLDDFAVDVGEAEVATLVTVGQAGVLDAHQV